MGGGTGWTVGGEDTAVWLVLPELLSLSTTLTGKINYKSPEKVAAIRLCYQLELWGQVLQDEEEVEQVLWSRYTAVIKHIKLPVWTPNLELETAVSVLRYFVN